MKNILITGGAGYIGSVLVPELLKEGHKVCVYDSLLFGGNGLLSHFRDPNFTFVKGDIRDTKKLKPLLEDKDIIIHLAAIVGYPACSRNPELTKEVNLEATKKLVNMVRKDQYILFGSTGSNYGAVKDICTEESPLNPLSLYGETKTEAEKYIMENCNATAYRFATAFGSSPRLRLDLLVNDFVCKAIRDKYIVVYESHFMRTFIHVYDIARSFIHAINNQNIMQGNVYNVGSNKMNCSKKDICTLIKKQTDYYLHLGDFDGDADKRNYIVSYDKISKTGFNTSISLEEGIDELVNSINCIKFDNPYSNV
tara:strand:- start:724 stop:1653 length:930 start_codon:yes stop_codon:yes gene_type:complete